MTHVIRVNNYDFLDFLASSIRRRRMEMGLRLVTSAQLYPCARTFLLERGKTQHEMLLV